MILVIIHSGHYRPVDAPDIALDVPDDMERISKDSLNKAANSSLIPDIKKDEVLTPTNNETPVSPSRAKSPTGKSMYPQIAIPETHKTGGGNILFPDHDLYATLRVLPKLIKYSGSTRHGLDSRGWGGSHDGESIQVVNVKKIERGTVGTKGFLLTNFEGRKMFSKHWGELAKAVTKAALEAENFPLDTSAATIDNYDEYDMYPDMTVVYSQSEGSFSIKYNLKVMNDWPIHLLNLVSDKKITSGMSNVFSASTTASLYTREELIGKEKWPFWRIKLLKNNCSLLSNDGKKYFFVLILKVSTIEKQ